MTRAGTKGAARGAQAPDRAPNHSLRPHAPFVMAVVLFVTFLFFEVSIPSSTAVQIGSDEGFELAKATLVRHGYKLYTEVWNDQPPLHNFLLVGVLEHLSPSVLAARMITSAAAAILLAALFCVCLGVNNWVVAALSAALLLGSPGFLELSSSCMLEIPALAAAVGAIGILASGPLTAWRGRETIAGLLFAAALQIKLIAAIYLPLAVIIEWLRRREGAAALPMRPGTRLSSDVELQAAPAKGAVRSLLILAVVMAVGFVAIDGLVDGGAYLLHLQQSWSSHFAAVRSFEYSAPNEHRFDWTILLKNWDTTLPAVAGVFFCWRQRRERPMAILPVVWLAMVLVIFGFHQPWWPYYYVHTAIPLCWCAAIGLEGLFLRARAHRKASLRVAVAIFGLCAAVWIGARVYLQIASVRNSPQIYNSLVLGEIARLKPFCKFMYTDEPVYSFHADIPMPPDLAVVPLKRLWSGGMSSAKIAEELREIKPGVILLATTGTAVSFQDLIDTEYRVVYEDAVHRLFALKTIAKRAGY
jgi:hypothetical protein